MAISLPLQHGGKKSHELNIPTTLSIPLIDLPEIGLYIPAKNYPLPSFTIPPSLDFTVPLLGLAEASTKINSNFYGWECSISGGNNTVDVPSYIVQYKAMAQSPFNLLSYKLEGKHLLQMLIVNSQILMVWAFVLFTLRMWHEVYHFKFFFLKYFCETEVLLCVRSGAKCY